MDGKIRSVDPFIAEKGAKIRISCWQAIKEAERYAWEELFESQKLKSQSGGRGKRDLGMAGVYSGN